MADSEARDDAIRALLLRGHHAVPPLPQRLVADNILIVRDVSPHLEHQVTALVQMIDPEAERIEAPDPWAQD